MLNSGLAAPESPGDRRIFNAVLIFFGVALATIVAAWGFEKIGGYVPCELCLKQRWAYYFAVPFAALMLRPAAWRTDCSGSFGPFEFHFSKKI